MNSFIKFFAVVGCVCIAQSGFAQFQKGSVLLGGSVWFNSYNGNTTNTENQSRLGIAPIVGYVFKDNWSAFVELGYGFSSSEGKANYGGSQQIIYVTTKENSFFTNIGAERLWVLGDNFGFALRGNLGVQPYSNLSHEEDSNHVFVKDTEQKNLSLSIGFSPSLTYQIGKRFNLRLSGGYLGFNHTESNLSSRRPQFPEETRNYTTNSAYSNLSFSNLYFTGIYIIQPKTKKAE